MGKEWEQSENKVGQEWEQSGDKVEQEQQSGTRMGNLLKSICYLASAACLVNPLQWQLSGQELAMELNGKKS